MFVLNTSLHVYQRQQRLYKAYTHCLHGSCPVSGKEFFLFKKQKREQAAHPWWDPRLSARMETWLQVWVLHAWGCKSYQNEPATCFKAVENSLFLTNLRLASVGHAWFFQKGKMAQEMLLLLSFIMSKYCCVFYIHYQLVLTITPWSRIIIYLTHTYFIDGGNGTQRD